MACPFLLFNTQPIVQAIELYMAYLLGVLYLALSALRAVWEGVHGENFSIAGPNYISLSVGFVLGAQVKARVSNQICRQLCPVFSLGFPLHFCSGSMGLPIQVDRLPCAKLHFR